MGNGFAFLEKLKFESHKYQIKFKYRTISDKQQFKIKVKMDLLLLLGGPFRRLGTNSANFKRIHANEPQKTSARPRGKF